MEVDERQLMEWQQTAGMAARRAGEYLQEQWLEPHDINIKGWHDWVTAADLASQQRITNLIRERHPDHGFLTEEEDPGLPAQAEVTWIIDPVDGTSNFSRQAPLFSISIAAAVGEEVKVGVVFDPLRDELFTATAGAGSRRNGTEITTGDRQQPETSIAGFDLGHTAAARQQTLEIMGRFAQEVHTMRIFGSAALALAWVAAGRLDVYMNLGLKAWDVAAGALLIQEAGGRLTDLKGVPWTPASPAGPYLASNGALHGRMLALARHARR